MSKIFGIFTNEEATVTAIKNLYAVGFEEHDVHVVGERGRRIDARYTQSPESDGMNPLIMGVGLADVLVKSFGSSDTVRSRLAGLGIPEGLLDFYEAHITRGSILVMVETEDANRAAEANRILQSSAAVS